MYLKGLRSGNKFEFPYHAHLHTRQIQTHKEQNLIPAGQKQRGEDQQLPQFFQRFLLVIINNVQMERQEIMTTCVLAIHLTKTKPEITAVIS